MALRLFSYRNKRRAKKLALVIGAVLLVFVLFCIGRFIYLQRYLIYSDTEVSLDYNQDLQATNPPAEPLNPETFPVDMLSPEDHIAASSPSEEEMKPLAGFHITTTMLQNMDAVTEALTEQDAPDALLLDMKSIYGNFYYASSTPGAYQASADISAITNLISQLDADGSVYLIARIPAFTDNNFALANQSCGLPLRSGALWMNEENCYWLDPLEPEVQDFLVSMATELAQLGFEEILFDNFYIPASENIVYDIEMTREEAAVQAAQSLRNALEEVPIRISFGSSDPEIAKCSDRIYLTAAEGGQVSNLVESVRPNLQDPSAQIVFLTASRDNRFEGYGLLRPLIEEKISD